MFDKYNLQLQRVTFEAIRCLWIARPMRVVGLPRGTRLFPGQESLMTTDPKIDAAIQMWISDESPFLKAFFFNFLSVRAFSYHCFFHSRHAARMYVLTQALLFIALDNSLLYLKKGTRISVNRLIFVAKSTRFKNKFHFTFTLLSLFSTQFTNCWLASIISLCSRLMVGNVSSADENRCEVHAVVRRMPIQFWIIFKTINFSSLIYNVTCIWYKLFLMARILLGDPSIRTLQDLTLQNVFLNASSRICSFLQSWVSPLPLHYSINFRAADYKVHSDAFVLSHYNIIPKF
jgi:hypothetical protein